jgi:hypothetical protein
MSQSFWCLYYCIFSYIAIIFFFKSSQVLQLNPMLKADLEAREYLVLYNVIIFPRREPRVYIKYYAVYTRRDKCVESCDTQRLRKIQCILIYNYRTLHSLDKIIWNAEKTSRDILSNKYSRMSRLQVCLDMCTQSKITRDVTWSCTLTCGHKNSPLRQGNKLIWKLPWLTLCPIEIIGIIYG